MTFATDTQSMQADLPAINVNEAQPAVLVAQTAAHRAQMLEADANGLKVSVAATALPTGAATEATLAKAAPGLNTELVDLSAADWTAPGGVPFTLIIGTTGAVKMDDANGHTLVLPAMPSGYQHAGLLTKVYKDASTTATHMVAVY